MERLAEHSRFVSSRAALDDALEFRRRQLESERLPFSSPAANFRTPPRRPKSATTAAAKIAAANVPQDVFVRAMVTLADAVAEQAARVPPLQTAAPLYRLSAMQNQKKNQVSHEDSVDAQRRSMIQQIYAVPRAQVETMSSAKPTRHVFRVGDLTGVKSVVAPRRPPKLLDDKYPHLSAQAAASATRNDESRAKRTSVWSPTRSSPTRSSPTRSPSRAASRPPSPTPSQPAMAAAAASPPTTEARRPMGRPASAPVLANRGAAAAQSAAQSAAQCAAAQCAAAQYGYADGGAPNSGSAAAARPGSAHVSSLRACVANAAANTAASATPSPTRNRYRVPPSPPPPRGAGERASAAAGGASASAAAASPSPRPLTAGSLRPPSAPPHLTSAIATIGNVRWRPAPSHPPPPTHYLRYSASTAGLAHMGPIRTPLQQQAAAANAMGGIGGGGMGVVGLDVGAGALGKSASASMIVERMQSERLLYANAQMRYVMGEEMEAVLQPGGDGGGGDGVADAGCRGADTLLVEGGEAAVADVEASALVDSPDARNDDNAAATAWGEESAAAAVGPAPASPAPATPPLNTRASEAHKRAVRAARARRILREAVKRALSDGTVSSVSTWSTERMSFGRLARVAVELQRTTEALKNSELFADLGERSLTMMASSGKRRAFSRYGCLYREHAQSTCFYVLTSGTLLEFSPVPHWPPPEPKLGERLTAHKRQRRVLSRVGPRQPYVLFGMESLTGKKRQSTITALTDCQVLRFSASDLNIQRDGAAKIARKLFNAFLEGELAVTQPFVGMPPKQMKQFAPLLVLEEIKANTPLYGMGNPGDKVFLLLHGSVEFSKGKTPVAKLSAEQGHASANTHGMPLFGESALLDRSPRKLAAMTVTDCKLLTLPLDAWGAVAQAVPDLRKRLGRLRHLPSRVDLS